MSPAEKYLGRRGPNKNGCMYTPWPEVKISNYFKQNSYTIIHMNTEYRIQNNEYRIQYTEYIIQNIVYRIQFTEYRIQHTGYRIQHTAYTIQNTEYRKQNTLVHSIQFKECCKGYRI